MFSKRCSKKVTLQKDAQGPQKATHKKKKKKNNPRGHIFQKDALRESTIIKDAPKATGLYDTPK